jgi:repressor LexA
MPPKSITRENILAFLRTYKEKNGYAPTLREIAQACAVKSLSVVQFHLDRLELAGAIRRDKEKSRSITLGTGTKEYERIPVLGTIAAGHPVSVPDADTRSTAGEWIDVPLLITRGKKDVYCLHVRGNSMVDALIADGDIVVMQEAHDIRNGDVAACWLKEQQEVTLKKIYFEGDRVRLQPCNPYMAPIYERAENIEIQGKLMGVIRRYFRNFPPDSTPADVA